MATPATDALEDDPAEHMAAELGPDISNAVFVANDPPTSLLIILDQAVSNILQNRERVIDKLEKETSRIEYFGEELSAVREDVEVYESNYPSTSDEELLVYYSRLGELRSTCAELCDRRQREVHSNFSCRLSPIQVERVSLQRL